MTPWARIRIVISCVAALVLGACSATDGAIYLAPGYAFALQPPASGPTFAVLQEIIMETPAGREERLVAQIENDATGLRLAAFTPLGQTLLTLQFDGASVKSTSTLPGGAAFDGRFVLALMQLSLWPIERAREGLGAGMTLTEEGDTREVRGGGKILWTIVRDGDAVPYRAVTLRSEEARLGLRITTLPE
jgi:hypothetical protein